MPMICVEDLVEVSLPSPEDFLKVRETLTRIGIASKDETKLFQTCHIFHKRGRYYIVHFKEMFRFDGLDAVIDEEDIGRRNRIAMLLDEWGLVVILNPPVVKEPLADMGKIKVVPFREKEDWELVPKYHMGNSKRRT